MYVCNLCIFLKYSLGLPLQKLWCLMMVIQFCHCESCDRRPLGTKTDPLPPDNRFQIEIIGISDKMYNPNRLYTGKIQK